MLMYAISVVLAIVLAIAITKLCDSIGDWL